MLKKLMQWASDEKEPLDPARFGDPIAAQTAWTPAKAGGTSFRTHVLVPVRLDRMEFRISWGAQLFYSSFAITGTGMTVGSAVVAFESEAPFFDAGTIMVLAVGLVFAAVGGCLLYFGTQPLVFDKSRGYYWRGREAPDEALRIESVKQYAELGEIHALQLIAEGCRTSKSSYTSYELNLVFKDGERMNVVDHGNSKRLRKDAAALASFLGVPLWDAI